MSSVIDAHLHLWDLDANEYAWLRPEHGPLFRSFLPDEAVEELSVAGVDGAILVQAANTETETRWLLGVADQYEAVVGVVGWIPLDEPFRAQVALDEFAGRRRFCGVRHLVHQDPRRDFLELPSVRRSLDLLAASDLPFDIPDAWPHHLAAVTRLADDMPGLRIVLDHLGKPPRGGDLDGWRVAVRRLARRPNVVAKISGLHSPGTPYTVDALRPVVDDALAAFGPGRLMYGGDWPMTVPHGGYRSHWEVIRELLGELSDHEQQAIFAGTARQTYQLTTAGVVPT